MMRRTSAPFGWNTARPEPISSGNENRSSSTPSLRWSRRFGFLEAVQVLGERVLRLPRGAVDALEHRALLVAAPVRARDLRQLERAEPLRSTARAARGTGRRRSRSSPARLRYTETPFVAAGLARVFAGRVAGAHLLDDLALVRLVGEHLRARRRSRALRARSAGRASRSRASRLRSCRGRPR